MIIFLVNFGYAFQGTIFAGQIHYPRIPKEYWRHRLQMVKAMGMNGISMYVFWNHHQISPGIWDFSSDNRNLTGFLQIAKQLKLNVFLRPGPYVCAEFQYGGLPYWLLKKSDLHIRSMDPYYLNLTQSYFKRLSQQIKPYLYPKGPIRIIQIQNQYGGWGSDKNYMRALLDLWKNIIGQFQYYCVDHIQELKNSWIDGLSVGINGGPSQSDYTNAKQWFTSAKTIFGGEIYPGWFTHWSDSSFEKVSVNQTLSMVKFFVDTNRSFSLYMVHGGTNWGYTSGADWKQAYVTSYDYDAPINQHGKKTPKFDAIRELFKKSVTWEVPDLPAQIPIGQLPLIRPRLVSSLKQLGSFYPVPVRRDGNRTYGNWTFQQNRMWNGMITYKFEMPAGSNTLKISYKDFLGIKCSSIKRVYNVHQNGSQISVQLNCTQNCQIELSVQSMGRMNVGYAMNQQRKGLFYIQSQFQINKMSMRLLPLDYSDIDSLPVREVVGLDLAYFYRADFKLKAVQIKDTYLYLNGFTRGYVWMNGKNLGRFWKIGPQKGIYLPGVWLKQDNRIWIMDYEINGTYVSSGQSLTEPFAAE